MKFKIIVDSSSDMIKTDILDNEVGFEVVPLTLNVGGQEFIDDENLDCKLLLKEMHAYKGKSISACPSPQKFVDACSADYNFIVTITSKLSGTYNSACLAASMLEEKKCFVIDSKSTSGSITLIAQKIYKLIKEGKDFETICKEISIYRDRNKFFFILDDFDNLIKNGRMTKLAAAIARIMLIKPICIADKGEIKIYKKVRTRKQALTKMVDEILKLDDGTFKDKECIITHCFAEDDANLVKKLLTLKTKFKKIVIRLTRGLCSFYALEKGILVSF